MWSENTLVRSVPCAVCGTELLWTQNAWRTNGHASAAYVCLNGHVVDPSETRQCPACGVHDTEVMADGDGVHQYRCRRCGREFQVQR
jgi:Zn ribbon nucleic-acid-binding protein